MKKKCLKKGKEVRGLKNNTAELKNNFGHSIFFAPPQAHQP